MTFRENYTKSILPKLKEQLGLANINAAPHLRAVVIHVGFGKRTKEANFIEHVRKSLGNITGQKPVNTLAKQSISNFKVRKGSVIGMKVTLRGLRMYDFLEKLITITLPRVPDFRGISKKVIDETGNLNVGFKDHISFPEVDVQEIADPHGIQITVVTDAGTKKRGLALFELMGFPFKKDESNK